jgi:hypothetical protein
MVALILHTLNVLALADNSKLHFIRGAFFNYLCFCLKITKIYGFYSFYSCKNRKKALTPILMAFLQPVTAIN